jgi:pimeloyl-ACP methyl ester carboxylesterase
MKVVLSLMLFFAGVVCMAQTSIERKESIVVGGIRQYVTMTGSDASLPLLLFLHGGPGGSVMGYADRFTDKLRNHFIVIQWDQRQTGKTLALNPSPIPLTFALFQHDTRELIDTLLKRFHREKLYIAGHSWGTALGFEMARQYPELLYAFIAIGPMINQLESERMALTMMKEDAVRKSNQLESEELARVRIPFENGGQLFYDRKWLLAHAGSRKKLSLAVVSEWARTWLDVFNEASREDLTKNLPSIDCPVYFFAGKKDYQTNSGITEAYYNQVRAPKKGLYWFDCAHSIPSAQPQQMQKVLIEKVLPETFTGERKVSVFGNH